MALVRFLETLNVFWRQLRPVDGKGHLVDLASKWEWCLVVAVVQRCGATGADVKGLVEW
jgi:hypothetical protein